jgi:hypothetical protein
MRNWKILILATLLLAAVVAPAAAQPVTVNPGDDGWVTPSNGSQVDLSGYNLAAVFGRGVTFSPTIVPLSGQAIDPAHLGSIDTIVRRFDTVTLGSIGATGTTSLEVKSLRLVGSVTVNGTTIYDLRVCLSDFQLGNRGSMTLTLTAPDGGTFNSTFPIQPKLTFTNRSNPSDVVVLDCGATPGNCPNANLSATNVCWVVNNGPNHFDPLAHGVTLIQPGIVADGTCDGVNAYTTVGSSNFFAGFDPHPPFPLCTTSAHLHANFASKHQVKPAQDCTTTTGTLSQTTASDGVITDPAPSPSPAPTPIYCKAVLQQQVDQPAVNKQ